MSVKVTYKPNKVNAPICLYLNDFKYLKSITGGIRNKEGIIQITIKDQPLTVIPWETDSSGQLQVNIKQQVVFIGDPGLLKNATVKIIELDRDQFDGFLDRFKKFLNFGASLATFTPYGPVVSAITGFSIALGDYIAESIKDDVELHAALPLCKAGKVISRISRGTTLGLNFEHIELEDFDKKLISGGPSVTEQAKIDNTLSEYLAFKNRSLPESKITRLISQKLVKAKTESLTLTLNKLLFSEIHESVDEIGKNSLLRVEVTAGADSFLFEYQLKDDASLEKAFHLDCYTFAEVSTKFIPVAIKIDIIKQKENDKLNELMATGSKAYAEIMKLKENERALEELELYGEKVQKAAVSLKSLLADIAIEKVSVANMNGLIIYGDDDNENIEFNIARNGEIYSNPAEYNNTRLSIIKANKSDEIRFDLNNEHGSSAAAIFRIS